MQTKSIKSYFPLSVLFVSFLSACTPSAAPLFLDRDFNAEEIKQITVLSVADLRVDESKAANKLEKLDKWSHYGLRFAFRHSKSNYDVSYLVDRSLVESITEDDLSDLDPDWVKNLGPSEARWVMLPVLNSFNQDIDIAKKVNLEISAYLFDKQAGKKIWFHKDVSKESGGILMPGLTHDCIVLAMQNMAYNLPKQNLAVQAAQILQ